MTPTQRTTKPKKLRGEQQAVEYLREYKCDGCNAQACVQMGRILTSHRNDCHVARHISIRHPRLRTIRV